MKGFFLTDRSLLGQCHPASRILILMGACVPPLFFDRAGPAACLLILYMGAALAFSCGRNIWRVRGLMAAFLIVTLILWPLFHRLPGPAMFKIGPFGPSYASILFALTMGLRMVSLLMAGVIFLSATRIEDISYGLERLGMPFRVSFAFSLAFRLTPLFMSSAAQVVTAQKVRGFDPNEAPLISRLKSYLAILAPVLITGLRRADGLALALESKGFGRSGARTCFRVYRIGWRDVLLLVIVGALIACSAAWRWGLFGLARPWYL
jgi:energy-coupling factor transport system permease protein